MLTSYYSNIRADRGGGGFYVLVARVLHTWKGDPDGPVTGDEDLCGDGE